MSTRWTEDQYRDFLQQKGPQAPAAASTLQAMGVPTILPASRKKSSGKNKLSVPGVHGEKAPRAKRRGVETGPIVASVKNCAPRVRWEGGEFPSLYLLFEGARLLTVNEIYSILQYRKYDVIRYKKAWHTLINRSLLCLPRDCAPVFTGAVRLELVRRAGKTLDDDGSRTPFKFAIDALVRAKVLVDDNRQVVGSTRVFDVKGANAVGIRIIAIPPAEIVPDADPTVSWFPARD